MDALNIAFTLIGAALVLPPIFGLLGRWDAYRKGQREQDQD